MLVIVIPVKPFRLILSYGILVTVRSTRRDEQGNVVGTTCFFHIQTVEMQVSPLLIFNTIDKSHR